MRFTLLSLVFVTFFAALIVNAVLQSRQASFLRADIEQLREATRVAQIVLRERDAVTARLAETNGRLELLTHARQELLSRFESHVDAKYRLAVKHNEFSMIEVPQFQSDQFIKTFRLHVPDDWKLAIEVSFEDRPYMTKDAVGKFVSVEPAKVDLPAGQSELSFRFRWPEKEVDTKLSAVVQIDSTERFSREFVGQQTRGYSSTNFFFWEQRDYSVSDNLPRILRFQPSGGDTAIVLQVVRSLTENEN